MTTTYRAGAIGRTGQGNFGHYLHLGYQGLPNVEFVAVSDPDPQGRKEAAQASGAQRTYSDYRDMLEREDLDLVSVCPRWLDCHEEMVIAAAEAGAKGIVCEKAIAPTLAAADAMIEACDRLGVRLAVPHSRAGAYYQRAKRMIGDGEIGDVQVIRAHGKQDRRSGAEDLIVLGTHSLDAMRYLAGADVAWANGHVTQDGRDATLEDAHDGDEFLGLMAGNGVTAYYSFANGVQGHFESHPGHGGGDRLTLEVLGTEGTIGLGSALYLDRNGTWPPEPSAIEWEHVVIDEWDNHPDGRPKSSQEGMVQTQHAVVKELVQAVEEGHDVVAASSGRDARAALEMIMAVHESHRLGRRVAFPLQNRENPYEVWRRGGA